LEKLIVKDMDIDINLDGTITSIIGPTNSGKTLFLKKLCNQVNNEDIYIDDLCIKSYDINILKNNIVVVLNNDIYEKEYVLDEMTYYLIKLGYRLDEAISIVEDITLKFDIEYLLHERILDLSLEEKILVKILSYLIIKPKIFALDNLLAYLRPKYKDLIINYIRDNQINLINVTSIPDELLYTDDIVVMNNNKAILCGYKYLCFEGNTILPYIGLKLPFIIDLSQNLILYNMIDKIYTDDRKLVDKLWK